MQAANYEENLKEALEKLINVNESIFNSLVYI